jgi:hypothetical protein
MHSLQRVPVGERVGMPWAVVVHFQLSETVRQAGDEEVGVVKQSGGEIGKPRSEVFLGSQPDRRVSKWSDGQHQVPR